MSKYPARADRARGGGWVWSLVTKGWGGRVLEHPIFGWGNLETALKVASTALLVTYHIWTSEAANKNVKMILWGSRTFRHPYISRFILPCKSDCQPIFLKMQGTYSLYAKLWLVKPLIKQIHGSSPRYLSNVTFETSLAFQMREECIFEKKKIVDY